MCLTSCDAGTKEDVEAAAPLRDITTLGRLQHPDLVEASGLVRSTLRPNVFWSQNDSRNAPDLFAYDSTGASLGVVHVRGATNRDWEAIAMGPCAAGTCLYIGDVGDNDARRSTVTIWRVPEPSPRDSSTPPAEALRFSYVQGPRDVEAMWVGPDTTIWLLTKRPMFAPNGTSRQAQLYKLPAAHWTLSGGHLATLVDSLPIVPRTGNDRTWITDASLSPPDSARVRRLAVRTYHRVYVFEADSLTGRPGALLQVCDIDALGERQGEGVTWLADGRLVFNEEGGRTLLHAGRCP